jgi:hypothetical protein
VTVRPRRERFFDAQIPPADTKVLMLAIAEEGRRGVSEIAAR